MSGSKSAAVYARFSTDRQDARSIDDQVRRCRAFAASRDLEVVEVFADEAVSGTHTQRDGLQALLADGGRRRFSVVLVDDLSRLSRDLGDMWAMIFGTLAGMDTVVIDVMTGMSSDSPAARMTFGAMGLVSDGFIQMVKAETHRGLEGRALAGFSAGGRTYGYTTRAEENPPEPSHPRRVIQIDETQAGVVRGVFQRAAEGVGLRTIADELNRTGVGAPHDHGKGNKGVWGWSHTTVRAMLKNERYTGIWRWNTTKWIRVPGRRSRRRVQRPENQHVLRHVAELRIINDDLWRVVQARFNVGARAAKPKDPKAKAGSVFSGLMRCGSCGSNFIVTSRVVTKGRIYQNLGCTAHKSRGSSICANARTVSERKVTEAVAAALEAHLTPGRIEAFVRGFNDERALAAKPGQELKTLQAQLHVAEQRLKNLLSVLADMPTSSAVREGVSQAEKTAEALKARMAETKREQPIVHPKAVEGLLRRTVELLRADPVAARMLLLRYMPPLILTPEPNGYRLAGAFHIDVVVNATPGSPGVCAKKSSGGVI